MASRSDASTTRNDSDPGSEEVTRGLRGPEYWEGMRVMEEEEDLDRRRRISDHELSRSPIWCRDTISEWSDTMESAQEVDRAGGSIGEYMARSEQQQQEETTRVVRDAYERESQACLADIGGSEEDESEKRKRLYAGSEWRPPTEEEERQAELGIMSPEKMEANAPQEVPLRSDVEALEFARAGVEQALIDWRARSGKRVDSQLAQYPASVADTADADTTQESPCCPTQSTAINPQSPTRSPNMYMSSDDKVPYVLERLHATVVETIRQLTKVEHDDPSCDPSSPDTDSIPPIINNESVQEVSRKSIKPLVDDTAPTEPSPELHVQALFRTLMDMSAPAPQRFNPIRGDEWGPPEDILRSNDILLLEALHYLSTFDQGINAVDRQAASIQTVLIDAYMSLTNSSREVWQRSSGKDYLKENLVSLADMQLREADKVDKAQWEMAKAEMAVDSGGTYARPLYGEMILREQTSEATHQSRSTRASQAKPGREEEEIHAEVEWMRRRYDITRSALEKLSRSSGAAGMRAVERFRASETGQLATAERSGGQCQL